MDESRIERLERERDYAINQARLLRAQLRGDPPAAPEKSSDRRSKLHVVLDQVQNATPEFLRAMVRRYYLKYFYFRIYPEKAPRAVLFSRESRVNPMAAHSGFAPFLEFKRQICRELSLDWSGISVECRRGLVSVILPVYNGQRFVEQAIASVLAQQGVEVELIVVDDGSTDATPAILERYETDPRVKVVRQENRKLPAALNCGFAHAQGEFYTWTSDDNVMRPGMLAALVQFLQLNSDAEMVFADEELMNDRGAPAVNTDFCRIYQSPEGSSVLRRPRDAGELNFVQNNFIGGCFLYRAWAAKAVGNYSEAYFGFEDYDYWMRMNALFRIAHLGTDDLLYSYRLHDRSLTARDRELRIAERARYSMAQEAERRRFFASGFDISFRGTHPWFTELTHWYRQSGHNVTRSAATAAFAKTILIEPEDSHSLSVSGVVLKAKNPSQIAYPLLALGNALAWRRKMECPGSR